MVKAYSLKGTESSQALPKPLLSSQMCPNWRQAVLWWLLRLRELSSPVLFPALGAPAWLLPSMASPAWNIHSHPALSVPPSVLSTSHDTEARRRPVGDSARLSPRKEEPAKESSEEEDENVVATWKPFLVNICMFTFLTAGAYLCYRVCFH